MSIKNKIIIGILLSITGILLFLGFYEKKMTSELVTIENIEKLHSEKPTHKTSSSKTH